MPVPGGPQRMTDCSRSRSMASRSGLPGRQQVLLADVLVEGARPHALGERRRVPARRRRRHVRTGVRCSWLMGHPRARRAGGRALPVRLEQDHGRGDGDVERLDRARASGSARRMSAVPIAVGRGPRPRRRPAPASGTVRSASKTLVPSRRDGRRRSARPRLAQRIDRRQPVARDRRRAAGTRCPSSRGAPSIRTGRPMHRRRSRRSRQPASAARTIAPRLPGSCTSTATTTSGREPATARVQARGTVTRADGHDARRGADRAHRLERAFGQPSATSTPCRASRRTSSSPPGAALSVGSDRRALDRDAGRERLGDQVQAVEQDEVASRASARRASVRHC